MVGRTVVVAYFEIRFRDKRFDSDRISSEEKVYLLEQMLASGSWRSTDPTVQDVMIHVIEELDPDRDRAHVELLSRAFPAFEVVSLARRRSRRRDEADEN